MLRNNVQHVQILCRAADMTRHVYLLCALCAAVMCWPVVLTPGSLCRRRPRQLSNMRHCSNKAFFITIRAVIFINQLMLLAPLVYRRESATFRTHAALTGAALVTCLLLLVAAPFLLRIVAATYDRVGVSFDALFVLIAMVTQVGDAVVALLLRATQIWQRHCLLQYLNLLRAIIADMRALNAHFVDGRTLALLWLQLSLALYELLLQLVFLLKVAAKIQPANLVANLVVLYLQQSHAVVAVLIFASLLLLDACYRQLERSLQRADVDTEQLVQLQNALHALVQLFTQAFQFPIFLLVIGQFLNVLANLYAQLYYYLVTHGLWYTFVFYCLKICMQMYLLIYAAQQCVERCKRVKHLWLNRNFHAGAERCLGLTHCDVLWPRPIDFRILGMFTLDNEFWLYLVSYSVNFIVIILQFGYEESH